MVLKKMKIYAEYIQIYTAVSKFNKTTLVNHAVIKKCVI